MKSIQKKNIILLGTWIFQAFSKFGKPQFVVWMIHLISNTGAFLSDVYLLDSGILMYQKGDCSYGILHSQVQPQYGQTVLSCWVER